MTTKKPSNTSRPFGKDTIKPTVLLSELYLQMGKRGLDASVDPESGDRRQWAGVYVHEYYKSLKDDSEFQRRFPKILESSVFGSEEKLERIGSETTGKPRAKALFESLAKGQGISVEQNLVAFLRFCMAPDQRYSLTLDKTKSLNQICENIEKTIGLESQANTTIDGNELTNRVSDGLALKVTYKKHARQFRIKTVALNEKTCSLSIQNRQNQKELGNVATLLSWQYRLTDELIGRDDEIKTLETWANSNEKYRIKFIYGDGGVGKSRLAFEFAQRLKKQGWQAGECDGGFVGSWRIAKQGLLLVIDYPEERPQWISRFLEALSNVDIDDIRFRVLLLCRNDAYLETMTRGLSLPIDSTSMHLDSLATVELQWRLFNNAWDALVSVQTDKHDRTHHRITMKEFERWLMLNDDHATPLIVTALALYLFDLAEDEPTIMDLRAPKILRHLSHREEKRIKEEVADLSKRLNLSPIIHYQGIVLLYAITAIRESIDSDELNEIVQQLTVWQVDYIPPVSEYMKQMSVWRNGVLTALCPDILAADFLVYALDEYADKKQHQWLEAGTGIYEVCDGNQPYDAIQHNIRRLARLSYDIGVKLRHPWILTDFGQGIREQPEQALWVSNFLTHYRFVDPYLQDILSSATSGAATMPIEEEHQAKHFTEAARLAYERGLCSEEAVSAAKQAIDIYNRLTPTQDNYNPIIARNCYVSLCCMAKGDQLAEQEYATLMHMMEWAKSAALQLIEKDRQPAHLNVAADTFFSYSYLLICGAELFDTDVDQIYDQAIVFRHQSSQLFKELAQDNYRGFGGHYGSSLAQLAIAYQVKGDFDECIRIGQQACEELAPFAAKDPHHWEFNYANALYFQALRLAYIEKRDESLPLHQQAITHYINLYNLNPAQFSYHLIQAIIHFMEAHWADKQLLLIGTRAYIEGRKLSSIDEDFPYPEFLKQFKVSVQDTFNEDTLTFLDFLIDWTQNPNDPDYQSLYESADTVFSGSELFA